MNLLQTLTLLTLSSLAHACIETGVEPVEIPLSAAGSESTQFAGREGWSIELQRADLAFGPLTLCAGATAAGLCETAHAEWQDSAVVDTLNPKAERLGEIVGISGQVRSWMYDLGFVSLLTREEPLRTEAARKLGSSARLEGIATHGSRVLHFSAAIDVRQELETERGVPVVSKTSAERFERDLSAGGLSLLVRFDPQSWFEQVNFEQLASGRACDETCDLDIELDADDQAHRALRLALVSGKHPTFTWNTR